MCGPDCFGSNKSSNHKSYSQKKTPTAKSYFSGGRRSTGSTYAGSGFGKPSVKSSLSFGSGKKKY